MATKKITDLVEITTAASDDVLPIVDVSLDITNKITTTNLLKGKQDLLESGTNIKTINSTSLLGSGDVAVQETLVSGTNIKTINSTSLLGSGDISISANPSGGAGLIQFSDGSAFASDSNLFWDNTNKRLGVAQGTPTARVHIKGSGSTSATTALRVENSSGVNAIKVNDDLVTEIGNQLNIVRTNVTSQLIEINANFGTIGAGIRAGGNSKDFIISAKNKNLYLSTNFDSSITQVQFALKHNQGVLIKDDASTDIDSSAKLEISSTTQGVLFPRMTTTQKNAISSPAAGLQVYDTTLNQMSYYNGTSWINF